MKEVDIDFPQPTEASERDPGRAANPVSAEAWDRRGQNRRSSSALACLEHAAQYLISDQMRPDRIYMAGAHEAVQLLREAMLTLHAEQVTRERVERLSSIWLPQQILARLRGSGPPAH